MNQNSPEIDQDSRTKDALFTLPEVLQVWRADWKWILSCVLIVAVLAGALSFLIPPTYKMTVVVQVKGKTSRFGAIATSPLADLAASAGVPALAEESADAAIGKLKSKTFARFFIEKEKLVDPLLEPHGLLGLLSWLSFDSEKEPKGNSANNSKGITPQYRRLENARKAFEKRVNFVDDKKTQLLTVTLLWHDPAEGADIANKIIRDANLYMRQQALESAAKNIGYLQTELSKTSLVPVQQTIYHLLEEQIKTSMMASTTEDFSLRFVDPAAPPLTRDSPKRRLIVLVSAVVALVIAFLYRYYRRRRVAP